jgi:hypothetical protein
MFEVVKRFFTTRYVKMIEGELVRLRAENRALTNSLLGTAGFPPLDFPAAQPVSVPRLRKRSWQQVRRKNELEAGRLAEID